MRYSSGRFGVADVFILKPSSPDDAPKVREMLESAVSAGTDSEAAKTMAELQTDAFVLLLMTSALMAWMLKRRNVRS